MVTYKFIKKINDSQLISELKSNNINVLGITKHTDNTIIVDCDKDPTIVVNNHLPKAIVTINDTKIKLNSDVDLLVTTDDIKTLLKNIIDLL